LLTAPGGNWVPSEEDPNKPKLAEVMWVYGFDPTEPDDPEKYWFGAGTSFATPHVVGSLALVMERYEKVFEDVVSLAPSYCIDIDEPGIDNNSGYGRIDTYRMYEAFSGLIPIEIPERVRAGIKKYVLPAIIGALIGYVIGKK